LGLNYKFASTDRSASQIKNPGVTPGFFTGRTAEADVCYWHKADITIVPTNVGGKADMANL
jgi:hypothetical protein